MKTLKELMSDNSIIFDEEKGRYTLGGDILDGITRTISKVKEPFDVDKISYRVARSQLGWKTAKDEDIKELQEKIKEEWDTKKVLAGEWGGAIHKAIEEYFNTGMIKKLELPQRDEINLTVQHLEQLCRHLNEKLRFEDYYFRGNEVKIFSRVYKLVGIVDKVCQRQNSDKSLCDIYDYKTNLNGISFDSISYKKEKPKHYNRMLLDPLSHLEDCTYNYDALQLSAYAYIMEEMGLRIGKLMIVQIDDNLKADIYPVPYMKYEIQELFNENSIQRKIESDIKEGIDGKIDW